MKNINNIALMVVVALIIAGASFFGGLQYEKSKNSAMIAGNGYAQGAGRFGGGAGGARFGAAGRNGGRATVGQIVSSDTNSITVKLNDGSSKIINISGSTKITKSATASMADLTNGSDVAVFGIANSDGSITAQTVQLNPQFILRQNGTSGANPVPTQ